jgi:multicomponent K+:H+ antiporter subunit A
VIAPDLALPLVIALPLVAGTTLAVLAGRRSASAAAWALAAVTAGALALVLAALPAVLAGESVAVFWHWVPDLGLNVSFRLDALAALFAILILGIGLLVILYARYYLGAADPPGKFYGQLALFMAAMLGVALADNLLLLAVFWELTSVASFLLIGYWQTRADARQGARMALAVTGAGGLAMLAGFLLLGQIAGTYEISVIAGLHDRIVADPRYPAALVLVLAGAFTKSAQFPFHFWLPEAMAAPTPVSAYLHSATMVKAGVFLLARLYPILGGTPLFVSIVATVGLVTFVFAAYVAVFKHDLKGLLAYSTISHLGLITFLIGLDSPLSAVAAVFHIVNHATFKASLFMAAGIIDHECGTRDMRRINGLWKYMPHTATLAIVAAAAMAGVPLLNGFLSKEMFFAEALDLGGRGFLGAVAPWAVVAGGAFGVAYSIRFVHDVFWNGEPRGLPRTPHEPPRFMKVPVEILVAVCIAVGVAPVLTVQPLVDAAARAMLGGPLPPHTIAIWHGFALPLALSAAAFAAGGLMYWALARKYDLHLHVPSGWTARLAFQKGMDALAAFAARVTDRADTGSLQRSLVWLFATALVLGATPLLGSGIPAGGRPLAPINLFGAVAAAVLAAAALGCVALHRDRLVAVILAGVVGLVVSLAFLYFSAPDLALTQFSVEVVSTVLLLTALASLPRTSAPESSPLRRGRDAIVAGAVGLGAGFVALAAMTRKPETISWFFMEASVPAGGGANVVNVILVDFRGYDTFGELTVLAIAALGVAALMAGPRLTPSAQVPAPPPLLLAVAARWLLPLALTVSIYLLARGHNAPGGGFAAGLLTAVALVLQHLAHGLAGGAARVRLDYARLTGAGLLVAGATGVGAWFFGKPFLTSAHGEPVLPVLGALPLASAGLFDIGVYLTVVGTTMLTLTTLAGASLPATTATARGRA